MKKLIIDRNTWARVKKGDIVDGSLLCERKTMRMCCMGFYCNQIHQIPQDNLFSKGYPSSCDVGINDLIYIRIESGLSLEIVLAKINDRSQLFDFRCLENKFGWDPAESSDEKQEEVIKELFKLADIEVEYIN